MSYRNIMFINKVAKVIFRFLHRVPIEILEKEKFYFLKVPKKFSYVNLNWFVTEENIERQHTLSESILLKHEGLMPLKEQRKRIVFLYKLCYHRIIDKYLCRSFVIDLKMTQYRYILNVRILIPSKPIDPKPQMGI